MKAPFRGPEQGWMAEKGSGFRAGAILAGENLLLVAGYLVAAQLLLTFPVIDGAAPRVWLPAGVALAALLLRGNRLIPGFLLGVLVSSFQGSWPPLLIIGAAAANITETLLAVRILRRLDFHPALGRARDVLLLTFPAGLGAALVGGGIGAAFFAGGVEMELGEFISVWVTWWLGDALGALILAPVLLVFGSRALRVPAGPEVAHGGGHLDALAIALALLLLTLAIWGPVLPSELSAGVIYLLFPLGILAGVRFGPGGAALVSLLVTGPAVWATAREIGPLALEDAGARLRQVWVFLGTTQISALLVAALGTERLVAETRLRSAALRSRIMARNATDMIGRHLMDGTFIDVSESSERIVGLPPSRLIGESLFDRIHPADRPLAMRERDRIMRERVPGLLRYRVRRDDDRFLWVETTATVVPGEEGDGRPEVVTVTRNIEDRRAEEEALRTRVRHQEALASLARRVISHATVGEVFDDALVTLQRSLRLCGAILVEYPRAGDERIIAATGSRIPRDIEGWRPLFGEGEFDPPGDESEAGSPELDSVEHVPNVPFRIPSAPVPDLRTEEGEEGKEGRRESIEFPACGMYIRVPGREGTLGALCICRERTFPFTLDDAHLLRSVAHLVGAAWEKSRVEEQLLHSRKMEAVGVLAGGVAHDFNNLLTAILGYASAARQDVPFENPVFQDLEQIEEAARRGADLTSQLLSFASRRPIEPRLLDLNLEVREVERMLRRLIGERIELGVDLTSALPMVRMDRGQFGQLLMNLVVNARDSMPAGGIVEITTRMREGGRMVELRVRDSGEGIPPEILPHIFEPFFTTKGRLQGTGLGLSTCYGIARQAGGALDVDSEVGVGTEFRVRLPVAGSRDGAASKPRSILPPS